MHLKIFWADETHGDADNVFKGVADSLFENDKELDGSFESFIPTIATASAVSREL